MATKIYPEPNINETTGLFEVFQYVSRADVTSGLFFPVIMLVLWTVMFVSMKQYSTSRAFTASSFICMILSILLSVAGLLAPRYMYMCIVLVAIGAVWLKLETSAA